MKKRILSILLLCCMVLTMLPTTVLAADGPMDTIPKYDVSIDVYNRTSDISIKDSRSYYIYSSVPDKLRDTWAWDKKIFIKGDKAAPHVFIDGVNIKMSPSSKGPAIELNKKASAYLYFIGKDSSLQGADGRAAIQKNRSEGQLYVLARTGTTVTCKGGYRAAGIGGSWAIRNIGDPMFNMDMYGHGVNMHFGSQSNPDYWGGTINATGGEYGAGIGAGSWGHSGYSGNAIHGGAGERLYFYSGTVNASGGRLAAGIGGGFQGRGSHIYIYGGNIDAQGGATGAGIGGGHTGDGSDIKITGGEVNASGGVNGAGIGGGLRSKGNDITVSGDAKLKVRGGVEDDIDGAGAGIGDGGSNADGSRIPGAEVEPDICALNPGGKIEYYAPGSSMSGTPNKTVTNPTGDFVWDSGTVTTPATCTGKGVRTYTCTSSSHTKTEDIPALNHSFAGQEYVSDNNATCEQDGTKTAKCVRYGTGGCTETDTVTDTGSKLGHLFEDYVSNNDATCEQDGTKTARCVRYGTGGCMATDTVTDTDSKLGHLFEDYVSNNDATYAHDGTKTAKCVRYDQCGETHTMPDEGSRLIAPPLYRVTDKDGRDIAYTAEQKGGVLTVTVDEDLAILTGRLSGIRTLKAQGVEKIVFVTKGATSAFLLSDLLDKGEGGEAYRLTHNGKAVTFTLGESMADVSAILTRP